MVFFYLYYTCRFCKMFYMRPNAGCFSIFISLQDFLLFIKLLINKKIASSAVFSFSSKLAVRKHKVPPLHI